MSGFDAYALLMCLIVFIALTVFFAILIVRDVKNTIKMISVGLYDEKIIKTHATAMAKQKNKVARVLFNIVLPIFFLLIVTILFGFSLYTKINESRPVGSVSTIKVVESGSMSNKNKLNDYLFEQDLNDQFDKFDIIIVHRLPSETELKLYDVVVYENEGVLIVHRIVNIVEPDEKHTERYYLLQGDSNRYPDRFPVTYSQMKGIYKGERLRYLGSFVSFMRSPSGYVCFALVCFSILIYPIISKKIDVSVNKRLEVIAVENVKEDI